MRKHIPNFLTCCNLVCGVLGIIFLFDNPSVPTAYFIWAAGIFDFFDGFAARWLKVSSPIGKELDSLADVVSFGVLPALFVMRNIDAHTTITYLPYVALLIAVCSALRLAIFNLDETQSDAFKGLPTPANAFFLTGLPFLDNMGAGITTNPMIMAAIAVVFSLLLVSRIDLFALKFKNFSWADNKVRFTFLALAVLLLAVWQLAAIPLVIVAYIVLSLGSKVVSK